MNFIPTFSNLESAGLLFGFQVSVALASVLLKTGLIFLPLIGGVLGIFKKAREDNTLHQAPKVILDYLLISFPIILFGFLPIWDVETKQLQINQECRDGGAKNLYVEAAPQSSQFQSSYTPKATGWWILMHRLGGGLVNEFVHHIPCHIDHHLINLILTSRTIKTPRVGEEYRHFRNQCYLRAYSNYVRTGKQGAELNSVKYAGNEYFLNTPGFYRPCAAPSDDPQNPCYAGNDPGSSFGVARWKGTHQYPSCRHWWLGDSRNEGLREILFKEAVAGDYGILPRTGGLKDYVEERDKDKVIAAMLTNERPGPVSLSAASNTEAFVSQGLSLLSWVLDPREQLSSTAAVYTQAHLIRGYMVLAQPLILLCLMAFFPLFFWISCFSFKALMLYTGFSLAVKAMPVVLVLSSYLSNTLGPVVFGDVFSTEITSRLTFTYVMGWLPVFMMLLLIVIVIRASFIGHRLIGFIAASSLNRSRAPHPG